MHVSSVTLHLFGASLLRAWQPHSHLGKFPPAHMSIWPWTWDRYFGGTSKHNQSDLQQPMEEHFKNVPETFSNVDVCQRGLCSGVGGACVELHFLKTLERCQKKAQGILFEDQWSNSRENILFFVFLLFQIVTGNVASSWFALHRHEPNISQMGTKCCLSCLSKSEVPSSIWPLTHIQRARLP